MVVKLPISKQIIKIVVVILIVAVCIGIALATDIRVSSRNKVVSAESKAIPNKNLVTGVELQIKKQESKLLTTNAIEYTLFGQSIHTFTQDSSLSNGAEGIKIVGSIPVADAKSIVTNDFKLIQDSFIAARYEPIQDFTMKDTIQSLQTLSSEKNIKDKVANIKDVDVSFFTFQKSQDSISEVATITIIQNNCDDKISDILLYDAVAKTYKVRSFERIARLLCDKPKTKNGVLVCSDCWLAPLDSSAVLPDSYAPPVVQTGLTGGGYISPRAKDSLAKLMQAIRNKGFIPQINSGYRSFWWQKDLFESSISTFKKQGMPESDAIAKTKLSIAPPNETEHRLGTAVDLACASCNAGNPSQKAQMYAFMQQNAHNYGFVISYTQACSYLTGKVYEPWHIRYIGKDLATELYNLGYLECREGIHLNKFLRDKGEY